MGIPPSVFVVALIAGATLSPLVNAGEIDTQLGASKRSRADTTTHSAKVVKDVGVPSLHLIPDSGKKANATLQDELNQVNQNTKQKQQYRNLENQMKAQQKGLNKQISNQAQAAPTLQKAGIAHPVHLHVKPHKRSKNRN